MGISFSLDGDYVRTRKFLKTMASDDIFRNLERYGREGVAALRANTPVETGLAAESWDFEVQRGRSSWSIVWTNSNIEGGTPVVIWLQYGHGTGTGGWVQGRDFINPALQPIFDKISNEVWKAVKSA